MLTRCMIKKQKWILTGFFSLILVGLTLGMKAPKFSFFHHEEFLLNCSSDAVFKEFNEVNDHQEKNTFSTHSMNEILDESIEHFKISEVFKNKYDELLNKKINFKNIVTSPTYSKLLILRESQEKLKDQFFNLLKNDFEKNKNLNLFNNEINLMFDLIQRNKILISEKIKSDENNSATIELSLSQFSDTLDEKLLILNKCLKKKSILINEDSVGVSELDLNKQKTNNRKELLKLAILNENLGTKEINKKSSFYNEIKQNWKERQKDLKLILENDRSLSNAVIYPSAGKAGNMFGLDFPENTYSITFDDGPGETTTGVLDHLKRHNLKATFFVLSKQILDSAYPKVALLEQEDGHALASHSYSHANMPKVSSSAQNHEINDAAKVFESRFGFKPKFFRLPYGAGVSISSIRQKIADAGMIHVFWTVDTLDWQDKDPESIMNRTLKQMNQYKRGIILFHDIHPQSVVASEMLMTYFNDPSNHIRSVTIPEIVDELNGLTPHRE